MRDVYPLQILKGCPKGGIVYLVKMKHITKILLVTFSCFLLGCGGYDHPDFPKVSVGFSIFPNDLMYYNLNWAGGYEYFTGGVNGVIVFRIDDWSFSAFDRACPHDWDIVGARIEVEPGGFTLKCPKCNSIYNILDGGKISGPSKYSLKPYRTRYDGVQLRVYS
jgi:nitrite reductase/ring-hydroxylating ferredoxin subunit